MTQIGTVLPVNIEDEVSSSYIDYAMSVIIGRALPDVRDGLKPVHRRILYAMYEQHNTYNRAYKKSARIVGDVIGKYHPHGDQAVYDSLVRMAQEFNMRLPLVDGQGNFGSVDGDPAAAMRYTEVRMKRVTNQLLADIEKETVPFVPNYDENESEPFVLPARIPNLLVNGSEGIAVGMATKIPPHNLGEVIDATIHLVRNPEATTTDLMEFVKGPDFPTAGIINGVAGIHEAYRNGRGIIHVRGRCHFEEDDRSSCESLIVTELPFQVNKARLIEKIAELVREKRIEGIRDIRDESDRQGMRIAIQLKRDAMGEIVLNQLYKTTALQSSFGIINLAIVSGRPHLLTLREILRHFLDFRRDVVTRRCQFELRKAQAREHILLGLQIALDHIDAIIELIRASETPDQAHAGLMQTFGLSEIQAKAILEMRLQRLTGLEREKIAAELAEVQAEIARLKSILGNEALLLDVIVEELEEVREDHADERRTEIRASEADLSIEDLIADEDMVVTVTQTGYIKRTPLSLYRPQGRGGKGRTGMATKIDDVIDDIFVASAHTNLFVFTNLGRVYQLKVHELPEGSPASRGRPIVNLLQLGEEETVKCVLPIREADEESYVLMGTELGQVKRTRLGGYSNVYARGIIAIKLRPDDHLAHVRLCGEHDRALLVTQFGQSIQFKVDNVRPAGRDTMGVRGITLNAGDKVVGMAVVPEEGDEDLCILSVTRNGFGKRTSVSDYPIQQRGGKGVITIKTSERNGPVVAARPVFDDYELIIIANNAKIIRTPVASISIYGRNTQGVRLMRLNDDEMVVGVAVLKDTEDPEDVEDEPNDDTIDPTPDDRKDS